jgi:NAD(P)-dependent dehydrogenase (short-subunit alcohol dehydrogenase family)
MSDAQRTILITGASGGIGRALIKQALERGDFIIAAALTTAELSDIASPSVCPVAIDVSDSHSVTNAFKEVDHLLAGRPLNAVIHTAAIAPMGTVEFTPPEEFANTLNINATGTLRVLQAALPRLRKSKGRIILFSSLWGKLSGPLYMSYASSKHVIEAMADSARGEARGTGVEISVVEPGVILTPMFALQTKSVAAKVQAIGPEERALHLGLYQSYLKLFVTSAKTATTAESCARQVLSILDARKPKTRYRIGIDAKLMVALAHILPDRWFDGLLAKMLKP